MVVSFNIFGNLDESNFSLINICKFNKFVITIMEINWWAFAKLKAFIFPFPINNVVKWK